MFLDVARSAHVAGKFERERLAKERAALIAPKLARLRLDVRSSASGLEILIDDVALPRAKWRDEQVLDPGPHRVRATAVDRAPWRLDAVVRDGSVTAVTVPELTPAAPGPEKAATETPGSSRRPLALALAGVGVAGLVVGGIAGAVALSSRGRAEDLCPESTFHFHCPTDAGAHEWSSASTAGNVATIALIAGGVSLAAAVVVWLTAPGARPNARLGGFRF